MILRLLFLGGILLLPTPLTFAQLSTWAPDRAHSEIDFSVLHLSLSNVRGRFGNMGGSIVLDESEITKSTVNITVDVTTVDTGVTPRDENLKSPGFFDVAQFPIATFVSSSVTKNGTGLTVSGDLTLHGVTKPVVLQVEGPTGPVPGTDKKPHSGFSATTMISRKAFGIATKFPVVGDEVMPPAHLVGRLFFPRVVADAARMEGVFRTSALDWTMVRPPQLTNAPFSGKYRARHDHLPVFGFNISRADVAEFMVKCAEDANSIRKILGVAH